MQPVVPERGLPDIVAHDRSQPLGIVVEVREDTADIRRIEWHMNDRIWPIKLPREFLAAGRLADHDRACRDPFVKPRRDLFAAGCEFGIVNAAAMGDEVAAVPENARKHDAMIARTVDAKCAFL